MLRCHRGLAEPAVGGGVDAEASVVGCAGANADKRRRSGGVERRAEHADVHRRRAAGVVARAVEPEVISVARPGNRRRRDVAGWRRERLDARAPEPAIGGRVAVEVGQCIVGRGAQEVVIVQRGGARVRDGYAAKVNVGHAVARCVDGPALGGRARHAGLHRADRRRAGFANDASTRRARRQVEPCGAVGDRVVAQCHAGLRARARPCRERVRRSRQRDGLPQTMLCRCGVVAVDVVAGQRQVRAGERVGKHVVANGDRRPRRAQRLRLQREVGDAWFAHVAHNRDAAVGTTGRARCCLSDEVEVPRRAVDDVDKRRRCARHRRGRGRACRNRRRKAECARCALASDGGPLRRVGRATGEAPGAAPNADGRDARHVARATRHRADSKRRGIRQRARARAEVNAGATRAVHVADAAVR